VTASTLDSRPNVGGEPIAVGDRRSWTGTRWIVVGAVALPTVFVLLIMAGMASGFRQLQEFPFFHVDWHWPALLTANTPTGGDMGAHVMMPQILEDTLLPSGRLLGWSMNWYAGFPAMYFYFPLPALTTVLLDVVLPYGVAFKLTTIVGLVMLPWAIYLFVRCLGFARVVAAMATVVGSMYLFMESFSIFGGNIKSTLAGEFAFSWSFALSLIYLGLVVRDTREERPLSPLAAGVLAMTALSHIITAFVVILASLPLLLRRRGPKVLGTAWSLGFALAAFWAIPLVVRTMQHYTTDMGWSPVRGLVGAGSTPGTVSTPLPNEFIPIFAIGLIGIAWSLLRREDVASLLAMTILPFFGYWFLQSGIVDFTLVYNARLLPYWFVGFYIFAGIAIGLAVTAVARWLPQRRQNLVAAVVLASLVVVNITIAGIHDVPGWVYWNYSGYEGKQDFPQYEALLQDVDGLPPGRVMWEINSDQNRFGTPMALMLIPYWSDDHQSMEGVLFESSLTTPFHFLNASEVSNASSNAVRGLDYRGMNFERALPHLAMYGIQSYVSFTPEAREAAIAAGLEQVAAPEPWTVFDLPDSSLVDIATYQPVVYGGDDSFLDASLAYYDDVEHLDRWMVASGPEAWPTVEDQADRLLAANRLAASGAVSDVEVDDHRISFHTTAVGVPHLVKVSYFPNWVADGADGPYRATPSLMVVVPASEDVVLEFHTTWVENVGMVLTVIGLALIGGFFLARRRVAR